MRILQISNERKFHSEGSKLDRRRQRQMENLYVYWLWSDSRSRISGNPFISEYDGPSSFFCCLLEDFVSKPRDKRSYNSACMKNTLSIWIKSDTSFGI